MIVHGYSKSLVVEGSLLFDCAGEWSVRNNGGADAGDVEVDVLEILDLVVECCFACHAVDGECAASDGDGDDLWRLLFGGVELLSVFVVSEVVFGLHDGFALLVEEGVSEFVALLSDGRVEHELAIGILPLIPFFIEHGGRWQLDQGQGACVLLLASLFFRKGGGLHSGGVGCGLRGIGRQRCRGGL